MIEMWILSETIQIPESEFHFSYVRSSGPGGQNVNKVNSKAVLRWNVLETQSLSHEVLNRLISRVAARMNQHGEIVISSDRFRDQIRNREDCLNKLREWILSAAQKPKVRKKTKPSRGS